MKKNIAAIRRGERGQSILIIALVMVGLIAFMGLAVDGGNLFMQRRRAQNAADSSVLAGTRVLAQWICDHGDSAAGDTAVLDAIHEFAEANGVANPADNVQADYLDWELNVIGQVGGGSISGGATAISVTLGYEYPTYFVTIVGIGTAGASANAMAVTGPAYAIGGLRPFGLPLDYIDDMRDAGVPPSPFKICFSTLQKCVEGGACTVEWTGGNGPHRGWFNFNCVWKKDDMTRLPGFKKGSETCEGASASDLRKWMIKGWDDVVYADGPWSADMEVHIGDFIHSWPGVEEKTIADSLNIPPGEQPFPVPIYDAFPAYEEIGQPKPATGFPAGGSEYYHIVGFANVTVLSLDKRDRTKHCIEGILAKEVTGAGVTSLDAMGGYGDPNACQTGIQAVNLYK